MRLGAVNEIPLLEIGAGNIVAVAYNLLKNDFWFILGQIDDANSYACVKIVASRFFLRAFPESGDELMLYEFKKNNKLLRDEGFFNPRDVRVEGIVS